MLGNYQESPFDWQFELLGIPVRVTGWFWLGSVIFGWSSMQLGVDFLLGWVLVCFISILVHEFGHALTARSFGYRPRVTLYQMGGLAEYDHVLDRSLGRSIAVSLAGPIAGFLLYAVIVVVKPVLVEPLRLNMDPRMSLLLGEMVRDFEWVNLYWGLLNLLPILPLDGGQVCRDTCLLINPRRGLYWALQISVLVGATAAWLAYDRLGLYPAVLFGLLAFESLTHLQSLRNPW